MDPELLSPSATNVITPLPHCKAPTNCNTVHCDFCINVFKGPMLGYIIFCQSFIILALKMPAIYVHHLNNVLADISLLLSTTRSLDSLPVTRFFPPFCLSHKLWNMDMFPYICSLPCVSFGCLLELHARGFKVIVYCWKPFHPCFVRIRRNWSSSDPIIHAFTSLIIYQPQLQHFLPIEFN